MSRATKIYVISVAVIVIGVVGALVMSSAVSSDPTKVTTPHEYAMAQGQVSINEHCAPDATPISRGNETGPEWGDPTTDGVWYRYEDYHTDATIGWVGYWYSFSDGTQHVTDEEREEVEQVMIGTICPGGVLIPSKGSAAYDASDDSEEWDY